MEESNKTLGPSPALFFKFTANPIGLFALLNLSFLWIKPFRIGIYELLNTVGAGKVAIVWYTLNQDFYGWIICLLLFSGLLVIALIAFKTTSYRIDYSKGEPVLFLQYGIFVPGGPNGGSPFSISTDTRLMSLISDVNPSSSISELIWGMGTLSISSANEDDTTVPYVRNPKAVTMLILENSRMSEARLYTSA